MTIATSPTDLRQDKELRKIYNWKENLKNVFYGEGRDDGRREIARKMLKKNSDISYISEMTDLSIEEIEEIKEEMTK